MVGQSVRKRVLLKGLNFCLLFFLLCNLSCSKSDSTPDPVQKKLTKVLSYNVLKGFSECQSNMQKFKLWIDTLKPDVIALQEMNGYTQASVEQLAAGLGYPYAVIHKETGFPLALLSRTPIEMVKKHTLGMTHGYLYGKIQGHHFFVTHLDPNTYTKRITELQILMDQVNTIPKSEKVLIMGDLNNMSPQDSVDYNNTTKMNLIRQTEANNPEVKILNNGKIDYTAIQNILDNGFYDSWKMFSSKYEKSAPTKLRTHNNYVRIDYIFVNRTLSNDYEKAYLVKDGVTDYLSDHYPMVFIFKNR